jgi:chromosomal replication initiation ATPase DnaA
MAGKRRVIKDHDRERANVAIDMMCLLTKITREELLSGRRYEPLPYYRFIVWEYLRRTTGLSAYSIAEFFGYDGSSIYHGIRAVEDMVKTKGRSYKPAYNLYLKFNNQMKELYGKA